jgi:predicted alpha/beta-hydrolase family hydrolase
VLCHGYMSDRNSELLLRIAGALARAGIASLRFDFSGGACGGGAGAAEAGLSAGAAATR